MPTAPELQLLYGARSHAAGVDGNDVQFTRPREMADGRILALMRPFNEDTDLGGDLLIINADRLRGEHAAAGQQCHAHWSGTEPRRRPTRSRTVEGPRPAAASARPIRCGMAAAASW